MSVGADDKQQLETAEPDEAEAALTEHDESPGEPTGQVRALDFSQPTKFTTELRRRIARALDGFSETLGGSLGGELNADVEVAVGEISQHTWAAAKAQLPADSIASHGQFWR